MATSRRPKSRARVPAKRRVSHRRPVRANAGRHAGYEYSITKETWTPEDIEEGGSPSYDYIVESEPVASLRDALNGAGHSDWRWEWDGLRKSTDLIESDDENHRTGDRSRRRLRIRRAGNRSLTARDMEYISEMIRHPHGLLSGKRLRTPGHKRAQPARKNGRARRNGTSDLTDTAVGRLIRREVSRLRGSLYDYSSTSDRAATGGYITHVDVRVKSSGGYVEKFKGTGRGRTIGAAETEALHAVLHALQAEHAAVPRREYA